MNRTNERIKRAEKVVEERKAEEVEVEESIPELWFPEIDGKWHSTEGEIRDDRPGYWDLHSTVWALKQYRDDPETTPDMREFATEALGYVLGPDVPCPACFGFKRYFTPAFPQFDRRSIIGTWRECVHCKGTGIKSTWRASAERYKNNSELKSYEEYTDEGTKCILKTCEADVALLARLTLFRALPICSKEHAEVILNDYRERSLPKPTG